MLWVLDLQVLFWRFLGKVREISNKEYAFYIPKLLKLSEGALKSIITECEVLRMLRQKYHKNHKRLH